MDRLSRGILGGIAGGFEAQEEVIDANMKERRDQAKQKALLKRQKNLARFQNDLAMDRQEAGWGQQEKVREEERDYQEGLLTEERGYQNERFEKKQQAKEDFVEFKFGLQKELAQVKESAKGPSNKDLERLENNTRKGASAFLSHMGFRPGVENENKYILDEKMSDKELDQIKSSLESTGLKVYTKKTDDGRVQVDLAGYDPRNITTSSKKRKTAGDHFLQLQKQAQDAIDKGGDTTEDASGESGGFFSNLFSNLFSSDEDQSSDQKEAEYGLRPDGTKKGPGFLGEIKNPDGTVSTEMSIGVNIDGKEKLIPLLVPILTEEEIATLQKIENPNEIPMSIVQKATDHAYERIQQGLSPFKESGGSTNEQPQPTEGIMKPQRTQNEEAFTQNRQQKVVDTTPPQSGEKRIGKIRRGEVYLTSDGKYMIKTRYGWSPATKEDMVEIQKITGSN